MTQANNIPTLPDAQGDQDLMCPFLGLKRIVNELQWPHGDAFRAELQKDESQYQKLVSKANAVFGNYVKVDRLMYARIFGAGHMPNEKRGPEVRQMIYDWIGIV